MKVKKSKVKIYCKKDLVFISPQKVKKEECLTLQCKNYRVVINGKMIFERMTGIYDCND